MLAFAYLLDQLSLTFSHHKKMALLCDFFKTTPDPERGFVIGVIANTVTLPTFKRSIIKELMSEQIDPYLFSLSYDYVGDMAETISLLWSTNTADVLTSKPMLTEILQQLNTLPANQIKAYIQQLLNQFDATERWALLKVLTGSLRIGVSARFIKQTLANYGNTNVEEIEQLWHALKPPYIELFSWLENNSDKPDISDNLFFHPVMLAHPLDDNDLPKIQPDLFVLERKFDGIRIQFIQNNKGKALFSRRGEEISHAFPDIAEITFKVPVILDGELVIKHQNSIGSFNDLQQRLNRKKPTKNQIESLPAHMILYDILFLDHHDVRQLPYKDRRQLLEKWYDENHSERISLSRVIPFDSSEQLVHVKESILAENDPAVEGLMIKNSNSAYIAGRPIGHWYKWKKDPFLIDAVLMYAQRGHGRRSSFYSDYTFGLWKENELLPIGKAYFGFTDEELIQLDKWIRHHTIKRFGPVREVEKGLVFEVAFDAVNFSKRHKSGFALRFPRINRIRWDKPAEEADLLESLAAYCVSK